jgi:hydrogenase nickel incorporation protein HypA/HybF
MHEYPAVLEIIRLAESACIGAKGAAVTKIALACGSDCGYSPECIGLYFDLVSKGTLCENAVLSYETIDAKLECRKCGDLFTRKPFDFSCPSCGGEGKPTSIGKEFYLSSVGIA